MAEFFDRPRPFLDGSAFVTTDTGTGLVHMAPDHGEDDFDLCKAHGIDPVFAVTADGKYRDDWAWLGGQGPVVPYSPKGLDKLNVPEGPICESLRIANALLSAAPFPHSYPHSWRSKAKVIYRCTPQWFIPMDKATGGGATLRQTALAAIEATRFVPEKGRNRIGAMVKDRPDWVISRQRAWGVPITLFVDRKTGQYLNDPAVNARIIEAVRAGGVDAWCDARAQEYLGDGYSAADYERVTDILDVWFDSGSTHAFVLESGRWPELLRGADHHGPLADLYLEGSDQHRGWFQSSLLESCGTRGRAPYKAVLTHGFTMDQQGRKMSKSEGNTVDPVKVMETYGADIIRLWALSVEFTEDHRIGDEILKGVGDQYRKLRNTFRYLLGALDGFSEDERVSDVAAMPELERYMLSLLAGLDARLRTAIEAFDFNDYTRALSDFCNEDLSAFFFDIRKDCLYCDAPTDPKRRAYRTVLDVLFHALVRYAAPILVFTAEEVWQARWPDRGSVHLLEMPDFDALLASSPRRRPGSTTTDGGSPGTAMVLDSGLRRNDELEEKWRNLRTLRSAVTEAIEPLRREKTIGSSLEAKVVIPIAKGGSFERQFAITELQEAAIISELSYIDVSEPDKLVGQIIVERTDLPKCARCWRHLPDVGSHSAHPDLCGRCADVVDHL